MLKRNLLANYLGQGWNAIMSFAFIPLYIRYMGIESYGLIGIFGLLTTWLSLLDLGMVPTLGREMARFTGGKLSIEYIRDLLRSIEIIALGIGATTAMGIALASYWLATSWLKVDNLPVPVVVQAFSIMGVVTALRFMEGVYRSAIIGLQRQVIFNAVNSTMATLRGLGAIAVLALVSPTIQAFFIWQGVVSVATLIILGFTTYARLPKAGRRARFSREALQNVWRFAGGMLGITAITLLLTQVDKILLSKLLSLTDFGYYSMATLVGGTLFILISPIVSAFYPRICEMQARNDAAGLAETYHKAAQLVTVVAGSVAILTILYSETVLHLWTQNKSLATQTSILVKILLFGNLLSCLNYIPYNTQLAFGWTSLAFRMNSLAVLLIVPAYYFATKNYGAIGAAWVTVILNLCYLSFGAYFMYRKILSSEKVYWYFKDLLIPLSFGLATALAIRWVLPEPHNILMQVGTLVLVLIFTVFATVMGAEQLRYQMFKLLRPFKSFYWKNKI